MTNGDVEPRSDVGAVFDVQAADLLAFRAGLVRDQLHAQDLLASLHVVNGLGTLTPPPFATATGVDLALTTHTGPPSFWQLPRLRTVKGECHGNGTLN